MGSILSGPNLELPNRHRRSGSQKGQRGSFSATGYFVGCMKPSPGPLHLQLAPPLPVPSCFLPLPNSCIHPSPWTRTPPRLPSFCPEKPLHQLNLAGTEAVCGAAWAGVVVLMQTACIDAAASVLACTCQGGRFELRCQLDKNFKKITDSLCFCSAGIPQLSPRKISSLFATN